jgi:ComF family protein
VIERLLDGVLNLLAPLACLGCDSADVSEAGWCPRCAELLATCGSVAGREIDGVLVLAALPYAPPVSTAVQRLKYGNRPDLAARLARTAQPALRTLSLGPDDVLVPVPLHPRRLAERGFNQAALLARAFARRATRVEPFVLARVVDTPRQATLSRSARLDNLRGAFVVRDVGSVSARRVVLVDDVVTTGATTLACIAALRVAGISPRAVISLAGA